MKGSSEMPELCKGSVWDGNDTERCGRLPVRSGYCQRCYDYHLPIVQERVTKAEAELKAARGALAEMLCPAEPDYWALLGWILVKQDKRVWTFASSTQPASVWYDCGGWFATITATNSRIVAARMGTFDFTSETEALQWASEELGLIPRKAVIDG